MKNKTKTCVMDFLEKYPKADWDDRKDCPTICPYHLGYWSFDSGKCDYYGNCQECWGDEISEINKKRDMNQEQNIDCIMFLEINS